MLTTYIYTYTSFEWEQDTHCISYIHEKYYEKGNSYLIEDYSNICSLVNSIMPAS